MDEVNDDLRRARMLVDEGPHWSPHPDIRDRVPVDEEWGVALVAVADLRAALAARPEPRAEGLREAVENLRRAEQNMSRETGHPFASMGYVRACGDVLALLDAATPPAPAPLDRRRLAEVVSDSLAAATMGTDYAEAPEPSDEPGSPYVLRLTNEILSRLTLEREERNG